MSTEQLEQLLESPDVPNHIKRHFAANCAERALILVWEATGNEPDPRSVRAVRVARLFAEGKASVDELAAARSAAWSAARYAARSAAWAADADAAWAADAAKYAARSAAWAADADAVADEAAASDAGADAEREWQLAHLLGLIDQHKRARSGLLALLSKRSEQLLESATPYRAEFEEALFDVHT